MRLREDPLIQQRPRSSAPLNGVVPRGDPVPYGEAGTAKPIGRALAITLAISLELETPKIIS